MNGFDTKLNCGNTWKGRHVAKVLFTQAAIKRAVKAAQAAGVNVARVEIDPKTGKIVIVSGEQGAEKTGADTWAGVAD